ncbi:MAG: CRISPR-associated helicase Cas3' [Lewinellaceae bacterium]|nr:CRISPR-associated helicase Cas3' [Lewinellaceae bacterium]
MPEFYSHAKTDEKGHRTGSKLLLRHTKGVTGKALSQFYSGHEFLAEKSTDIEEILEKICLLHDLGKYTTYFQDYLLGRPHDQTLKQHARFGAQAILQYYGEESLVGRIAYFVVKNHHRNLHNPDSGEDDKLINFSRSQEVVRVFDAQCNAISSYIGQIEEELEVNDLAAVLVLPRPKRFYQLLKNWIQKPDIQNYFLINYLFSLLIEGDKLDASDTPLHARNVIPAHSVSAFLAGLNSQDNEQNRLRNQVREEVIKNLSDPSITDRRLFILTAPTGIGKTLTALDFALQLRAKLTENPQIIVGLPFINIIEQTLAVYQEVLAETGTKILGHYQYADIFGEQDDPTSEEEKDYNRRRMELDTWQSDIIITSFVQLLQTIISNRNKLLLKFNHLAGAIVIMDEVQSLRLDQVPVIGAVLYYMSKFLGTRFILMTATKPLIFELAGRILLEEHGVYPTSEVRPLLPDPKCYFEKFHRTQIIPIFDKQLNDADEFFAIFQQYWVSDKSCLIVCNTVNRSIEVFEKILRSLSSDNPVYYLSTNVLPLLRLAIIQDIKKDLKNGRKPILVSTQVVEAGVDLDFDMGFRDVGPIDSIVQVAGRINRENSLERRYSPLYVMDLGDCQRIYGLITDAQAKKALGNEPILEPDYYSLVEDYFWKVSGRSAYGYSEKLFRALLHLQYSDLTIHDPVIPIWKFRVIEESPNTVSVFVDWDEYGIAARQAYVNMLNAPDREERFQSKEQFNKEHKRNFHQRIIAVPKYYAEGLPSIDPDRPDLPIKWISGELRKDWYIEPIGFNRKQAKREQTEKEKAMQL